MFTGIVQEVGTVEAIERGSDGARLRVAAELAGALREGDSVSVSGACLTVASGAGAAFEADVMNQTLAVTTLGTLEPGDPVNLESPILAGEPLGGHLVQGHVDGTAEVREVSEDGFARRLRLAVPAELQPYVVERGSIAVDGASLTVVTLDAGDVEVSLIPETLERTTLGSLEPGDRVNVEVDLVARHVERLVQGFDEKEEET